MHNLSETRSKPGIQVTVSALDNILRQVFDYYSAPNQIAQQNDDFKPQDPTSCIRTGFWLKTKEALFPNNRLKQKEPEPEEDVAFSYVEAGELDPFTAAHQDTPHQFYQAFCNFLNRKENPSSLAFKLPSVVLALFKAPGNNISLEMISDDIKADPAVVLAALAKDILEIESLKSDFFANHQETRDQFVNLILEAFAHDVTLGQKSLTRFGDAFTRRSLDKPKFVITKLEDAQKIFDLLGKLLPNIANARHVLGQITPLLDWKIPLSHDGDHRFLAVRRQENLMALFFPSYTDQPLSRQAILSLSRMGSGINYQDQNIAKTDWLKIFDQIAPKVADGITLYLRFLDGGECIGGRGFFTGFRHGNKGRARALNLRADLDALLKTNDPSDYFKTIANFFAAEDTRYHNNSLSNYIRRELAKLPNAAEQGNISQMTYAKACALFRIDEMRFTQPLPKNDIPAVSSTAF